MKAEDEFYWDCHLFEKSRACHPSRANIQLACSLHHLVNLGLAEALDLQEVL